MLPTHFRFAFFFVLLGANAFAADPRNRPNYALLFDIEARGETELVDGYGAYLQWYDENPERPFFRYCDNFEGKGLDGRPNLSWERKRFVPFGVEDKKAYRCHDYTPAEVARGKRLVYIGEKDFFALKTAKWDIREGGEILFKIAKRVPLIGAPTYRFVRIRATPAPGEWKVETLLPKSDTIPTEWYRFAVTASGLGIPNGITSLVLNPGMREQRPVDLDELESPDAI